jgi:hypothetical protein
MIADVGQWLLVQAPVAQCSWLCGQIQTSLEITWISEQGLQKGTARCAQSKRPAND